MTRETDPLDAEIARAVEDVERLRAKVAAGAPFGDALACAQYKLAGLRRQKAQTPDPPEAA